MHLHTPSPFGSRHRDDAIEAGFSAQWPAILPVNHRAYCPRSSNMPSCWHFRRKRHRFFSSHSPASGFRDLWRLVKSSSFPSQIIIMKKTVVRPGLPGPCAGSPGFRGPTGPSPAGQIHRHARQPHGSHPVRDRVGVVSRLFPWSRSRLIGSAVERDARRSRASSPTARPPRLPSTGTAGASISTHSRRGPDGTCLRSRW